MAEGNGPQYEMGTWVDVERDPRTSRADSYESQDAILRNEEVRPGTVADVRERNVSPREFDRQPLG
jgi:hypothetical protein